MTFDVLGDMILPKSGNRPPRNRIINRTTENGAKAKISVKRKQKHELKTTTEIKRNQNRENTYERAETFIK